MTIKVSIVLPVHNTEHFLEQCLESLINQTLEEIEILAVDDGSTDRSGEILDTYAGYDTRIRVIHQSKQGQAVARNRALSLAQGEYIGAIDADDWAEPTMFARMYEVASANRVDIVLCGWTHHFTPASAVHHYVDCIPSNRCISGNDYAQQIFPNLLIDRIPGYFWQKLYRKSLVQAHDLKVTEIPNNSDWHFACAVFTLAQSLYSIPTPLYHYRNHSGNQLLGKYREHYFDNILFLHSERMRYLKLWKLETSPQVNQAVLKRFIELTLAAIRYEFLFPTDNRRSRAKKIQHIVDHETVQQAVHEYQNVAYYDKGPIKGGLFVLLIILLRYRNWFALYIFFGLATGRLDMRRVQNGKPSSHIPIV